VNVNNPADVIVSTAVDGMPQRMIMNEFLSELENSVPIKKLFFAIKNALAYRKYSGATIPGLLKALLVSLKEDGLTPAQSIMQANAPMVIQKAMVDGKPAEGVLPSGQISGAIQSLESCESIINNIIQEAETRLNALQG